MENLCDVFLNLRLYMEYLALQLRTELKIGLASSHFLTGRPQADTRQAADDTRVPLF
jgi:hypothetical protein